MSRVARWIAAPLLLSALALPVVSVRAQDEAPETADAGGSSGSPLYGYLLAAFLIAGGMFILCKSARR